MAHQRLAAKTGRSTIAPFLIGKHVQLAGTEGEFLILGLHREPKTADLLRLKPAERIENVPFGKLKLSGRTLPVV